MYRKSDLFLSPSECNEKNHKTNVTKIRKIPKTNVTKIGKHVFNTQNECNENQAQNLQKTNVTKVLTPNSYVHKLSDFVTFVLCKSNFGFRYIRFVYNFWFSLHSFCLIFVLIFVTSFHVKKNIWLSLHPFCEAKSLHSFRNLADFREIRLWESALGYICILLQRSRVRACSHLARRSSPRIIKVMDLSGPRIIEGNHPESAPRIIKGKQLGDPRII